MRRKPAILLFLLIFLSLGGAILFHHLRKDPRPPFAEVDAFLKNEAATGDLLVSHFPQTSFQRPRSGWWDHLGIHLLNTIEEDEYVFLHANGTIVANAVVGREHGIVEYLYLKSPETKSGAPLFPGEFQELEKIIYGRFPAELWKP